MQFHIEIDCGRKDGAVAGGLNGLKGEACAGDGDALRFSIRRKKEYKSWNGKG